MRRAIGILVLLIGSFAVSLHAQKEEAAGTSAASSAVLGVPAAPVVPHVVLGDAAVPLYGPWRFHTGDDAAWADPGFADSGWETVDLTPTEPGSDTVPGWTQLGHPTYSGYAWYRLKVKVDGAKSRLALRMPRVFDDAYEVYVDGKLIGSFGKFKKNGEVVPYSALPEGFKLDPKIRNGEISIAVRMWMDSATRFISPDAGGMHDAPILGFSPEIATQVRMDWDDTAHGVGSGFLEMLVLLLALIVGFVQYTQDRTDKAYLWLGLVSAATLLGNLVVLFVNFTTLIPETLAVILRDVVFAPLRIGIWVLFWAYWFRIKRVAWLRHSVTALVLLLGLGTALIRPPLFGQVIPVHDAGTINTVLLVIKLALAALLIVVTFLGIRRDRAEGWFALPAVLLAIGANYQHELRLIHIKIAFKVAGFVVSLGTASTILSLLLVTLMMSRRFLLAQRKKVLWKVELDQAREVQQVLIPDAFPRIAGFSIVSEYRPARDVGGDFFQIIPHESDGSVLLIVGDVTGKGMRAGMLVALIVGVIQTAAHVDGDPKKVLETLNDRMSERENATATCLAMLVTADGHVTVVNAGHLAPYVNGVESPVEGSLPLGIVAGVEYPVSTFQMNEGDVLTVMSDGVAEAQDDEGQLFGFERIEEMLKRNASAEQLAIAAQKFGQDDDILVLQIMRLGAGVEVSEGRAAVVGV